jgi:hypothetical protein
MRTFSDLKVRRNAEGYLLIVIVRCTLVPVGCETLQVFRFRDRYLSYRPLQSMAFTWAHRRIHAFPSG